MMDSNTYAMAYAQRAIQRFLTFDGRDECPNPDVDYEGAVAGEGKKLALTEDLCAANEMLCNLLPPLNDNLEVLHD